MVAQSIEDATGLALMTQFVMHGWSRLELSLLEHAPASQGYLLQQPPQQTTTLRRPRSRYGSFPKQGNPNVDPKIRYSWLLWDPRMVPPDFGKFRCVFHGFAELRGGGVGCRQSVGGTGAACSTSYIIEVI